MKSSLAATRCGESKPTPRLSPGRGACGDQPDYYWLRRLGPLFCGPLSVFGVDLVTADGKIRLWSKPNLDGAGVPLWIPRGVFERGNTAAPPGKTDFQGGAS